ncbi:glycosyltransferase family 2 protein [Dyella monticola]|uniref:Glycosyltransferase family 2 protein n=1 Tax=Dyella monticola TaxID=1927958 RepID=A0A370X5L8_9GAMM|nr:glycosyltransferase family 2 protein [Dyella monticola]RDS83656.1 glycosyltransferase family 2 protein [Dyella monticola]
MSNDLVSVIMPVYNAEPWLQRAIDSVLSQSHTDLELIAVDDGSSDRSPCMLDAYAADDPRVRVVRQPSNQGVAAARNAGIAAARGDYIAFLDADDWWHPAKLERQLTSMRNTGSLISYTSYWRVTEDGGVLSKVMPPPQVDWRDMLASNFIGNLTGMYARQLGDVPFQRIGHEDYVFWLEQVRRAGKAVRVESPEPLAWYLVRERSLSGNKLRAASWQWDIYRSIAKLGMMQSAFYMARYVQHAVLKRRGARI